MPGPNGNKWSFFECKLTSKFQRLPRNFLLKKQLYINSKIVTIAVME